MTLKLLCFDLDNTLWPVEPVIVRAEAAAWQWLAQRAPAVPARITADRLRAQRVALLAAQPDYRHNLTALRRDAVAASLRALGYGEAEAAALAEGALAEFLAHRNLVTLFPDARAVLERLANKYRLAVLTNGNADIARIGLDHLFDTVLSAESTGRAKPDPEMFVRALRAHRVRAGQAVHIGDHPEQDVQAARAHGLAAIWANPLQLARPETLPEDIPGFEFFAQLEPLLEQIDD